MKTSIWFNWKRLIFDLGWFPGDEFMLFGLTLFEYHKFIKHGDLYLVNLQIAKFSLVIGINL
jgi:hypothetical protein